MYICTSSRDGQLRTPPSFRRCLTVAAGDVEVALVELAEAAELHVGLISPVHLGYIGILYTYRSPTRSDQIRHKTTRERRDAQNARRVKDEHQTPLFPVLLLYFRESVNESCKNEILTRNSD